MNFRKRIRLAPGIHVNLSGSGVGLSLGPRGASVSLGKRGAHLNTSIPGTGLYSRTKLTTKKRKRSRERRPKANIEGDETTIKVSVFDDGTLTFNDTKSGSLISSELAKQLKREKADELRSWLEGVFRFNPPFDTFATSDYEGVVG